MFRYSLALGVCLYALPAQFSKNIHATWFLPTFDQSSVTAFSDENVVRFFRTDNPNPNADDAVQLSGYGPRNVVRFFDESTGNEVFYVVGYDIGADISYVDRIVQSDFTYGEATTVHSRSGELLAGVYSASQGGLYLVDIDRGMLEYCVFDQDATALVTTDVKDLTPLDIDLRAATLGLGVDDSENPPRVRLHLRPDDTTRPSYLLDVTNQEAITTSVEAPYSGWYYFSPLGQLLEGATAATIKGVPGTAVEVFSARTGTIFGTAITDSRGDAIVPFNVSPTSGDVVGVRRNGNDLELGSSFEFPYASYGTPDTGRSGLTCPNVGRTAATNVQVGAQGFDLGFSGRAGHDPSPTYFGAVVIGTEAGVATMSSTKALLIGSSNVVALHTAGRRILGSFDLPIPSTAALAGQRFCFQWIVLDGMEVLTSNVACVTIRSGWVHPVYR